MQNDSSKIASAWQDESKWSGIILKKVEDPQGLYHMQTADFPSLLLYQLN